VRVPGGQAIAAVHDEQQSGTTHLYMLERRGVISACEGSKPRPGRGAGSGAAGGPPPASAAPAASKAAQKAPAAAKAPAASKASAAPRTPAAQKAATNAPARRRSSGPPPQHTSSPTTRAAYQETRQWLLKEHGPVCAYCARRFPPKEMTLDHVTPRKGQSAYDRRDNLVLACKECNAAKADMPILAFLLRKRERAVSLAQYGVHLSHMLREMVLQIADGVATSDGPASNGADDSPYADVGYREPLRRSPLPAAVRSRPRQVRLRRAPGRV